MLKNIQHHKYPYNFLELGCQILLNPSILYIQYHIHIGIFIFNCDYLIQLYNKKNEYYQTIEDLEWLKVLEQDYKIYALQTDKHEIGVDTQEDYEYLKNKFEKI